MGVCELPEATADAVAHIVGVDGAELLRLCFEHPQSISMVTRINVQFIFIGSVLH